MIVNSDKTKLLMINPAHTKQVVPLPSATPGNPLLCVGSMRLLGLMFDDLLTWWPLVRDISSRARRKTWALLRLREAGAPIDVLLVTYCTRIRSVLEYGAQVWGGLILGVQANVLENCQTHALQVILGSESSSYQANLRKLSIPRLSERRKELIK